MLADVIVRWSSTPITTWITLLFHTYPALKAEVEADQLRGHK